MLAIPSSQHESRIPAREREKGIYTYTYVHLDICTPIGALPVTEIFEIRRTRSSDEPWWRLETIDRIYRETESSLFIENFNIQNRKPVPVCDDRINFYGIFEGIRRNG